MMQPLRREQGHNGPWDQTFDWHPFYQGRTTMGVWSDLCSRAIMDQQARAAFDAKGDRDQTVRDRVRALDAEWWRYGGPDRQGDDPRELAFRRVVAEVGRDYDMAQQEASRSHSWLTVIILAAVSVGLARAYVFWRWETFPPDIQGALHIGWFIALPLMLLTVAIIDASVPRMRRLRPSEITGAWNSYTTGLGHEVVLDD
jgi:hypothetical protein